MKKILFLVLFITSVFAEFIQEPIFNQPAFVQTYGDPSNEAVVFVHGLGDEASTTWEESAQLLKDQYYVLIFDLPGFGKSAKGNQLYNPEKYAQFIDTLIDNFVDKPFHLVGHSMGASISLKYTYMYQSRVKSLMLIDAAAILNKIAYTEFLVKYKVKNMVDSDSVSNFVSEMPQKLQSVLPIDMNLFLNNKLGRKVVMRSNPGTIAAMALVEEDFSDMPRKIEVPTLILWGEDDKIAPIRTGYVLHKLIPNSKMITIPNSGHVPIVDSFDIYFKALQKHLEYPVYIKEEKNLSNRRFVDKTVDRRKDLVISGNFKRLEIYESDNITIKDAVIEELFIYDSKVNILNSKLPLTYKSYIADSKVKMTATEIDSNYPIELYDSKLDLAGVDMNTNDKIFVNLDQAFDQEIIFSLCTINRRNIHEIITIQESQSF